MRSSIAFAILLASALLGGASATRAQRQTPPTLDALLADFASIQGLTCNFHEEKRIALLTMPVISEGTIAYARPGRLARRTTRPAAQVVLIDSGTLRMSDGGHEQRIDLASQPVVRSFVDSFVQLLAGDRAALERSYAIAFTPAQAGAWSITLRPRSAPLDRFLSTIVLEGTGTMLARMVMTEVSGDVTTTTFSEVDRDHRFSAAEATRTFALP